jgi:hypothetical protein
MGAEMSDIERSLAHDLKHPLLNIARQAELAEFRPETLKHIQQTAEQTLMLLDSYLLSAQGEYGQTHLDLSPVHAGALFYDATRQLERHGIVRVDETKLDIRESEPIMSHPLALTSLLSMFGMIVRDINDGKNSLVLRSYKGTEGKIGLGIFSAQRLTQRDVDYALEMRGQVQMPLTRISNKHGSTLSIADNLCKALGGELLVKKMGRLSGLVTELPKSEQLAFI